MASASKTKRVSVARYLDMITLWRLERDRKYQDFPKSLAGTIDAAKVARGVRRMLG